MKMLSLTALAAAIAGVAGLPVAHAGCSNASLWGDYAFRVSGQVLVPNAPAIDREGVAMAHFDGHGLLSQVDYVMSNGTPLSGESDPITGFHDHESGTYTVYPDCTGQAEIDMPAPPNAATGARIQLKFVLGANGRVIHTVVSALYMPGATTATPTAIHSDGERLQVFP